MTSAVSAMPACAAQARGVPAAARAAPEDRGAAHVHPALHLCPRLTRRDPRSAARSRSVPTAITSSIPPGRLRAPPFALAPLALRPLFSPFTSPIPPPPPPPLFSVSPFLLGAGDEFDRREIAAVASWSAPAVVRPRRSTSDVRNSPSWSRATILGAVGPGFAFRQALLQEGVSRRPRDEAARFTRRARAVVAPTTKKKPIRWWPERVAATPRAVGELGRLAAALYRCPWASIPALLIRPARRRPCLSCAVRTSTPADLARGLGAARRAAPATVCSRSLRLADPSRGARDRRSPAVLAPARDECAAGAR